MVRIDLTGQKFNRWLVIDKAPSDKHGKGQWICRCDCGNELIVASASLRRNLSKSCGCYQHEKLSKGYKEISGSFWRKFERHAFKRNIPFTITIQEGWEIFQKQKEKCALSGVRIKFVNNYDKHVEQTSSPDRIDNTKPYSKDNLQWVHKKVNRIKSVLSEDELLFWCEKILKNKGKTKLEFNPDFIGWK
jgi:hypothetical protein